MFRAPSIIPIAERPARVLIVDSSATGRAALTHALHGDGYDILEAQTANEAVQALDAFGPDLMLLAVELPDSSGFELCGEVRAREVGAHTPIILVSQALNDEQSISRGLLAGADDYVGDPTRIVEFRARVRVQLRNKRVQDALLRLREERDNFRREATVDPLTGIMNRRSLEDSLSKHVQRGELFALLFMDLDHFKSINDRFGHDVGDAVLRAAAEKLKKGIRPSDLCGRLGGEEFVAILVGAGTEVGVMVAERHRRSIGSIQFDQPGYPEQVTVSIGVAVFEPGAPDRGHEALLRRADGALYEAKRAGRNRVALAPPVVPEIVVGTSTTTPPPSHHPSFHPEDHPVGSKSPLEIELVRLLEGGRAALPILPDIATEALRLANDPNAHVAQLARLVERSPPIAARFLSVANSALYSRGTKISSIQTAIVRLGLASTRDLLFQVAYESSLAGLPRYKDAVARSFRRSVLAGLVARQTSLKLGERYAYDYLCGLLHDIGEAHVYRILASSPEPREGMPLVTELVRKYHTRAGAAVATAWKLPPEIVEVCEAHHDDNPTPSYPVRLVRIADAVVEAVESLNDLDAAAFERFAHLGVNPELAASLVAFAQVSAAAMG